MSYLYRSRLSENEKLCSRQFGSGSAECGVERGGVGRDGEDLILATGFFAVDRAGAGWVDRAVAIARGVSAAPRSTH